jgi:sugar lactone lactonase YvrE
MHFNQQFCSSFLRARRHIETRALTIAITLALTAVLTQSALGQRLNTGGLSSALPTQHATQSARAFPHLDLASGRELEYLGTFQPDGKFRRTSRHARFLDAMSSTQPESPAQQAARQSAAPAWMLSSSVRKVDDIEPPAHAMALPDVHSRPAVARNAVVSFVYGGRQVLETPQYLTTDSRHRLIISDPGIPAVHVLDSQGRNSFSILGGKGHRLQSPAGVAVDKDDNIYVVDSELGMVLVYDQYGRFLRYIGDFNGENMYQGPSGIAIDRNAGHLYLLDSPRHLVFMLDLEGNVLKRTGQMWDDSGAIELTRRNSTGPRMFSDPTEIAVNHDEVVVLDKVGTRVQIMDLQCNLLDSFSVQKASLEAGRENGLALDEHGNVYISYAGTSEVRMYNSAGGLLASFGQGGSRMGEFSAPSGLWVDANNRLYVADTANVRVQLFQLTSADETGAMLASGR